MRISIALTLLVLLAIAAATVTVRSVVSKIQYAAVDGEQI